MLAYADAETLRASSESSINSCSTIGPDAGDCKNGEAPSTSSRNTRIIFVDAGNHDEVMAMDPRHTLFISMHWCVEMGGGKTFSTAEVRAACVVDPSSSTSRRGGDAGWHASVVLDVGRTLLSTCVEDTPLTRYLDCMTEFSRDVLPTISRQHAEMVLHLVGGDDDAAQVRCRGYDITDHVSATTFREVALHPHHRYPFQCHLSSSSSSSSSTKVNDHQDVVLELALGKRCRLVLTLHHAPHQRQRRINPKAERTPQKKSVVATKRPRATDAQPNTHADTSSSTSVSGTTRRRAAGRSRTRVIEMDATKTNTIDVPAPTTTTTTTSSTCSPTMKIFTTGISLTAADERRARALGLHINPSLQCASAAHILVVEAPLRRSIKLLSVLPFVDVVADVAWLRDVLRRKDLSINPRTYVYHEDGTTGRRSKLELANNFCLADFLQRSPSQRQELMSGLSIWIHPCTQPQQPPQNDIRSVVIASGGVVAMEASRASVVLMPSLQPTKHQWRTAISAGLCMTSSIIIITSDDLLRSVLQQKRIDASTVCAPTTFATD